mgnify:CR=1 FL=1
MNLSNLTPAEGAVNRDGKRVGRGQGSGKGGTATRGHKGAKSRSGYSKKMGFEGGQMPLQRRVPKFGFTNIKDEVTFDNLVENGLVRKNDLVKILGGGELKASLKISVHKFTATAKAAIEAAGGEAINL